MTESLLTPKEVAAWLKMSLVWVYKQTEKGLLPFHRVGEAIRFDPGEIRAYLNNRKDLKKGYPEPRNPKPKKRDAHLATQQEVTKTDHNINKL